MRDRTEYSSESNLQQRNNSLSLLPKGYILIIFLRLFFYFLVTIEVKETKNSKEGGWIERCREQKRKDCIFFSLTR